MLCFSANISSYSHYVFSTLDHEDSGIITFEVIFFGRLIWHCSKYYILYFLQDFVIGLSILVRGTLEEKVRWMFTLYDQDRDGYISRYENKVATTTFLQYQISVYNFQLNPDLSFQKVILRSYSKVILE